LIFINVMGYLKLSRTKFRRISNQILDLCPHYMGYPHMSKSIFILPKLSIHYSNAPWCGVFHNYDLIIRIYPRRIKSKMDLVRTIVHEYTHYVQMYNSPRMDHRYTKLNHQLGYKDNPFEIEARENEIKYMRLIYSRIKHLF